MGIDISNKLMLVPIDQKGLFAAIQSAADAGFDGDFHCAVSHLGLDYASPWFDASISDCDFGVEMPIPSYTDLIDSESKWFDCLHEAQDKIEKLLGWEANTKLSSFQHVY
jgi:hypothetical protein